MSNRYNRIVKDDPTTAVILDPAALAVVLRMMAAPKVRGLQLTSRLKWVAHVQRNGVLFQKEFIYAEKAQALAWLICTRAEMKVKGLDHDGRGKWRRKPEAGNAI